MSQDVEQLLTRLDIFCSSMGEFLSAVAVMDATIGDPDTVDGMNTIVNIGKLRRLLVAANEVFSELERERGGDLMKQVEEFHVAHCTETDCSVKFHKIMEDGGMEDDNGC